MKKLWLALWVCAVLLPRAAALSAAAAVTMDADTGETLFAENADSRLPMAWKLSAKPPVAFVGFPQ